MKTCPESKRCGGCTLSGVSYETQLNQKLERVRALLKPFCKVEGILGMEEPTYYRNKVTATFSTDAKKNMISGRYEEGTRNVVPVRECLIEDLRANRIISVITALANSFRFTAFDPRTGRGLFRHVQIRTAHATGQIMVTLVLGTPVFPSRKNFLSALNKECPEITTVLQSVNDKKTGMILGDRVEKLYGPGFIEDELLGLRFRFSPESFYQVNPIQTEKLYRTAIDFAALRGNETVIDAYSGIGTVGLCAAAKAGRIIGCELNPQAVRDAGVNRNLNGIRNASFVAADAGEFMVSAASSGEQIDAVFMDPPREGSSEAFLHAVLTAKPAKVVYISCNPETLARDLAVLTKGGYRAEKAKCVDMFPMTEHVECVVLLSKHS